MVLKDTVIETASTIIARLDLWKELSENAKEHSPFGINTSAGAAHQQQLMVQFVHDARDEIKDSLQVLVAAFPIESADDDQFLSSVLENTQANGDDERVNVEWVGGAVRQRLSDLHVQLSASRTMLRVARAKIKRRNIVLKYIQETLHREVLYFHEQLLIAIDHKERIPDIDVGVFSFLDFLELMELKDEELDSSDNDSEVDIDPRVDHASDPAQREKRRKRKSRRRLRKGDEQDGFDLLGELTKRWKATESTVQDAEAAATSSSIEGDEGEDETHKEGELGKDLSAPSPAKKHGKKGVEDKVVVEPQEEPEGAFQGVLVTMRDKITAFERQISKMSGRYTEEITKVRAAKIGVERKLHTANADLSIAIAKLKEVQANIGDRDFTIIALNKKCEELEALVSLLRLQADSDSASKKNELSAQRAHVMAERSRVQKVLEKLVESGVELPSELMESPESESDDPMMADVIRNAQNMSQLKDQLASALAELNPLREEAVAMRNRAEEYEGALEKALRYFHQLGLPIPEELKKYFSAADLETSQSMVSGELEGSSGVSGMKLVLEKARAQSQLEDVLDMVKMGVKRMTDFQDMVGELMREREAKDKRSSVSPLGQEDNSAEASLNSSSLNILSSSTKTEQPTTAAPAASPQGEAPQEPEEVEDRINLRQAELEAACDNLELVYDQLQERSSKDGLDLMKLRDTVSEQRWELVKHQTASRLSKLQQRETRDVGVDTSEDTTPSTTIVSPVKSVVDVGVQKDAPPPPPEPPKVVEVPVEVPVQPKTKEARSTWTQTVVCEILSTPVQTDAYETLEDGLKQVERYMQVLESESNRDKESSPLRHLRSAKDAYESLDARLICSACGVSLRPQSLAPVDFDTIGVNTDPELPVPTANVEVNTDPLPAPPNFLGGAKRTPMDFSSPSPSGTPPLSHSATKGTGSFSVTTVKEAAVGPSIPFESPLHKGTQTIPPGVGLPRHLPDGTLDFTATGTVDPGTEGFVKTGAFPHGHGPGGRPIEGAGLDDISWSAPGVRPPDWEPGLQRDSMVDLETSLNTKTDELPSVDKKRHVSSATRRRMFSAGERSAQSSSALDDDDTVSWSTEHPNRPPSGGLAKSMAGRRGDLSMSIDQKPERRKPHRKIGEEMRRSLSPPPPMFHHHFPASNKPTVRAITPGEVQRVKEEFVDEFGVPLPTYKQLGTRKRRLLLLPPAEGVRQKTGTGTSIMHPDSTSVVLAPRVRPATPSIEGRTSSMLRITDRPSSCQTNASGRLASSPNINGSGGVALRRPGTSGVFSRLQQPIHQQRMKARSKATLSPSVVPLQLGTHSGGVPTPTATPLSLSVEPSAETPELLAELGGVLHDESFGGGELAGGISVSGDP